MKSFVDMSKYAGMREDLVQAGGGNSAYKISPNKMVIKASGVQLADVTESEGYAIVNPQIIMDAFMNCDNLDEMTEEESKKILEKAFIEGNRPSIETFLHSILGRYSLHTHPIVVNALTCRDGGENEIKNLFPDALIVPYATPGVELAKAYFGAYKKYIKRFEQEPTFIFLMNHGFITSADSAQEVIRFTEEVTMKIENYLKVDFREYHEMIELQKLFDDGILWKVTDYNVLHTYSELSGGWNSAFCPDCVVFLGKKMCYIGADMDKKRFDEFVNNNGVPTILATDKAIYIHSSSVKKAFETQSVLSFSAQVMYMNGNEKCLMLSEDEINFLLGWDAEKYRKNMK